MAKHVFIVALILVVLILLILFDVFIDLVFLPKTL